jgi:hypothetical protein
MYSKKNSSLRKEMALSTCSDPIMIVVKLVEALSVPL